MNGYGFDDTTSEEHMEEDKPVHEPPLQTVHPNPTTNIPSSSHQVPSSPAHIPPSPTHKVPQSSDPRLVEAISGFH